ncbi:hypothetical protein CSQ85_11805 [Bifidobacterium rousetti]|uniref:hypothetical protein n=1 Tax=Bifidobacterium rousetti TaxID=2045439 RepID=UPI00123B525D|nr:hypothetical protein [Bifidobacterium rousetti]KAA8816104.1 hypothetical protein CSQ85_11805 [Bifidobacterium rousetti]
MTGTDHEEKNNKQDDDQSQDKNVSVTSDADTASGQQPSTGDIDVDDTVGLQQRDSEENRILFSRLRIPILAIGFGLLVGATGTTLTPTAGQTATILTGIGELFGMGGVLWMFVLLVVDSIRRLLRLWKEVKTIWRRELAKPAPGYIPDDDEKRDEQGNDENSRDGDGNGATAQ